MAKKAKKFKGFSVKQTDEIVKQAREFWDSATEKQSPFFNNVTELERLYRVLLPQEIEDAYQSYPDRSSLVPADIHNNMNSIKAKMRQVIFAKAPWMELSHAGHPTAKTEQLEKAEQVLQAMNELQSDGRGLDSEAKKVHHQALYAGLTACFTQWVENVQRTPYRDPETKQMVPDEDGKPILVNRTVSQYAETISLDIRRCRLDPMAAETKDIRLVGYHSLQAYTDLKALNDDKGNHYNFDEEDLWESTLQREKYFEYINDESDKAEKAHDNELFSDKQIEVQSFRGIFRLTGPGGKPILKDLVVEIGNREVLLGLKENDLPIPGWQMFDFPSIDSQHGNLYVMGVVEPARDAWLEKFFKRNQALDAANRRTYNTYIADSAAVQNLPNYVESSNDQIIRIDLQSAGLNRVSDAFSVLERPSVGGESFEHSAVLGQEVQEIMRLNDYTQGRDPGRAETATGIVELTSGGNELLADMLMSLRDTFYAPAMKKKMILWNFFMGDELQDVHAIDGSPMELSPGELDLPYLVRVNTVLSSMNPELKRRLVEFLPLALQSPLYDQYVLQETVVEVLGIPNGDRLLPPQGYVKTVIDRESALLSLGRESPADPLDNHSQHIQFHQQYLQFLSEVPPEALQQDGVSTQLLEQHIEEHQGFMEQANAALGNTKEGGGLSSNLTQPAGAALNSNQSSPTGNYTPSESRR